MRAVLIESLETKCFGATFAEIWLAGILLASVVACSQIALCQSPANEPLPTNDTASKSLADVARENRKQKSSDKNAKVVTNSDLSGDAEDNPPPKSRTNKPAPAPTNSSSKAKTSLQPAVDPRVVEQWKKQIATQKNAVARTEAEIAELRAHISSIDPAFATHSAQTEYYSNMTYDRRLGAQLAQLHAMEEQLAQQRQRLDEMQEFARHAGLHTTTYDP